MTDNLAHQEAQVGSAEDQVGRLVRLTEEPVDSEDQDLNTSVSSKKTGSTLGKLRAIGLIVLGGLGGGIFSKVTSTEAETLEKLNDLTTRVETIDTSTDSLVMDLREALEEQVETGQNIEEVNRILTELIKDQKDDDQRLKAGKEAIAGLTSAIKGQEEVVKELEQGVNGLHGTSISSRLRDLASDLSEHQDTTREPSAEELWENIMAPTVRLQGRAVRGSGVLLGSEKLAGKDTFETLLLTNYHVVEGIRSEWIARDKPEPFKVVMYDKEGKSSTVEATIVVEDKGLDTALLKITTKRSLGKGVKLPTRAEIAEAVKTFNEVYAAGCPMGIDPVPSKGQITDSDHTARGRKHMLISAPAFPGNSGGPVMDAETYALLGLVSMVYTAPGTFDRQFITHMGIVVPVEEIYQWLEKVGKGDLIPKSEMEQAIVAKASTKTK
ncbi:trypsin-like peptidase domain-containing protein [Oligoflexia bacterium]|nr:trypsin-like peptidase domain-containing protein [Oligoflexia bacterium]